MDNIIRPELKTPPPPEIAYLDLDSLLFKAAQAGEQIIYFGVDEDGNEWGHCDSAAGYKNWLEEIEMFGCDMLTGYVGDPSSLTRNSKIEIKEEKKVAKAFDHLLNKWIVGSGCKEWVGYVSKKVSAQTFRHDLATIKGYKSGRAQNKPHYLEEARKYALTKANVKTIRGPWEVDDVVCALAQRKGWKGCVVSIDKDSRGVNNTHVYIPEEMEKPEFSSKKIVGKLWQNEKGKVLGLGSLFWLYQCLAGDAVDAITGCKGVGSTGAYKLLQPFSGAAMAHFEDVLRVVAETYQKAYGESHEYPHHESEEVIVASWRDIFIENSHLVYMRNNQKDECFWVPMIRGIQLEE